MSATDGRSAGVANDARAGRTSGGGDRWSQRPVAILAPWPLQVIGCALAALYAAVFIYRFKTGTWLVNGTGMPRLTDFTFFWIGGMQALHGNAAALFDPDTLVSLQKAVVGTHYPSGSFFLTWAYPPTFFLLMAPLAVLRFVPAFLTFQAATLLGCIAVVFLIVRRFPAIVLVLASPFTAHNVDQGQTALLVATLVGAALLTLERHPALAGVFIGCLTYKPQFGVLIPVALIAAGQWRALVGAAMTTLVLAAISVAAFGVGPWLEFPRQLFAQSDLILNRQTPWGAQWSWMPTVYGLVRAVHGSAGLARVAQATAAAAAAAVVWRVWRSRTRYALKAALLSAALPLATPYAWPHDLCVIVIPLAFLAADQMRHRLLSGEQAFELVLFGAVFTMVFTNAGPPGPVILIALVGLILRRILSGSMSGTGIAA